MCSSVAAATSLLLHNFCALRFVTLLLVASFMRSFVSSFVPSFVRSFARSFVLSVSQSVSFFVLFFRWLFLPSFFFCFLVIPDAPLSTLCSPLFAPVSVPVSVSFCCTQLARTKSQKIQEATLAAVFECRHKKQLHTTRTHAYALLLSRCLRSHSLSLSRASGKATPKIALTV